MLELLEVSLLADRQHVALLHALPVNRAALREALPIHGALRHVTYGSRAAAPCFRDESQAAMAAGILAAAVVGALIVSVALGALLAHVVVKRIESRRDAGYRSLSE